MKFKVFCLISLCLLCSRGYAQQKVTVVCPECGHNITIILNVDGAAFASHESVDVSANSTTRQCKATTAKGTQCSRKAQDGSEYCWQHAAKNGVSTTKTTTDSSPAKSTTSNGRCRATTKAGTRCTRNARSNGYCYQHGG